MAIRFHDPRAGIAGRDAKRSLAAFAGALALASALAGGACHSIEPYLDTAAAARVHRYVVLTPEGREFAPGLVGFVERKRAAGLEVELLTFAPRDDLARRVETIQAQLAAVAPPRGERAYLLLLATVDELPMGPWRIEGLEYEVDSDVPLLLPSRPRPGGPPIGERQWAAAFEPDHPWICGRIPFADEAVVALALAAAPPVRHGERAPLALLGAERYVVWADTSLVMDRARNAFLERGFRAVSYAEDWPGDVELGDDDLEDANRSLREVCDGTCRTAPARDPSSCDFPLGAFASFEDPERLLFSAHWAHLSPDVVYLDSHGSSFIQTTVGDYLLSERVFDRLAQGAAAAGIADRPRRPAVLVVAACQAGIPDATLTERLFRDGWVRAFVASTENTDPTPLWPSMRAVIHVADALASGPSVGLAMRAVQESYYDDARASWFYSDHAAALMARNLMGMTLFGDPSVPTCGALPASR